MQIIQLGHRKRQGKDTFAEMLHEKLPNSVVTSFARPMKEILYEAIGVGFEEGENEKNINPEFRKVLQRFGSSKMKDYFGKAVWRDVLLNNLPDCDYLIITDFRFPEEHIPNALTVKVHRDDNDEDQHISETALKDFDFDVVIFNDGTLEELAEKAEYIKDILGEL